jgi:hypothetical protein
MKNIQMEPLYTPPASIPKIHSDPIFPSMQKYKNEV